MATAEKRPYAKPTLIIHGSVRNLTGGSGRVGRDGAIGFRNTPGGR